jgi:hypothetical protein
VVDRARVYLSPTRYSEMRGIIETDACHLKVDSVLTLSLELAAFL